MIVSALNRLTDYPAKRYIVGFSGGIDSTVLLHAMVQVFGADNVVALHVNHQLQACSAEWAEHCGKFAESLNVKFKTESVNEKPLSGDSIEAFARSQRRAIFKRKLQSGEVLLTAQHQNDQAETILLQLCRGAGVKGLSAMPYEARFGEGLLMIRPFLEVARSDIELYAKEHQLKWLEDPLNQDERFSRNFIRHQVMPLLHSHYPGVVKAMARSASHCQITSAQLDQVAAVWLEECEQVDGLNVKILAEFSEIQQLTILHHWLNKHGFRASEAQLRQLQKQAHAKAGSNMKWQNREVSVTRDGVCLRAVKALPEGIPGCPRAGTPILGK